MHTMHIILARIAKIFRPRTNPILAEVRARIGKLEVRAKDKRSPKNKGKAASLFDCAQSLARVNSHLSASSNCLSRDRPHGSSTCTLASFGKSKSRAKRKQQGVTRHLHCSHLRRKEE